MAVTVAFGELIDLGAGPRFIGLELLDQRVAEDCRDGGKLCPATTAHGLHLTVLTLRFGALAAGVNHAVAGGRQFCGVDRRDAANVHQVLLLTECLQLVFGLLQLGAQLQHAGVHPVGSGHGHLHGRVQLALDEAVGHGVGSFGCHARVGHFDLQLDQLALAEWCNADALHEGLGDLVENLRFGRVDTFFQVFRQDDWNGLADAEAGQQAANVD
ncbi:hypothetical protein D3C75_703130 [compost metagenome]